MNKAIVLAIQVLCIAACSRLLAVEGAGVDLARLDGWDIVVAGDAIPSERYAAGEFQHHFELASGKQLAIVEKTDRPDRHVFIGRSRAMLASNVGFDPEQYGEEDLRIIARNGNIAIAGGRPRGTLYGVYVFLEDYLGVRFLTVDHTHVPPVGDWRIVGPVDRFYHPPLAMRWSYYGELNRNMDFAARVRVNTVTNDEKLGGIAGLININHSFAQQINSKQYGEEHPEYYCLIDGKRRAQVKNDAYGNEPCLTNPQVLRIVTQKVLAEIEAEPHRRNFSVSQNDNDKYCRCDKCAAIDGPEGTPMGSLLTFVNSVADEVGEQHPDVWIGTLSYWYTRQPPKTLKPRSNVPIQLCSIECCLIHPINDPNCETNVRFCQDLSGWAELTDKVSIWNYNTNFQNYLLPCPNLRVIEPNVRFFVANDTRAIFMQAAGNGVSAELSELRNYMIASLIWDPNRSGQQLMDEFLSLHYGKAAAPIRRYIDLIHDAAEASGVHRHCFAKNPEQYGIDQTLAPQVLDLFAQALALAKTDEIKQRVEKASIPAYRLAIHPVWDAKNPADVDSALLKKMRPLVRRFLELGTRFKVDRVAEHTKFEDVSLRLGRLIDDARGQDAD